MIKLLFGLIQWRLLVLITKNSIIIYIYMYIYIYLFFDINNI